MEDIIMQIPNWCDDCETWHQEFIWAYDDGSYSVCDSDGDHEPLEEADLPSQEEHDRLWREYRQWVLDRGEDPLGEFYVRHSTKVKERWQFKFTKTLLGPRLTDARRAGRTYPQAELPEHVRSFLALDAGGKLGDFATWEELTEVLPAVKAGKWMTAQVEYDRPRSEAIIARELRKIARLNLTK
jgi:hypothetical protein